MSILLIVPTRGRPHACAELLGEFFRTRAEPDATRLMFAADDDDPLLATYRAVLPPRHLVVGRRIRMGPTLNAVADHYVRHFDVIGFMGDDHRPRTVGWDRQIEEAIGGGCPPGVAYGNDLIHGPNLPTAAFVSSSLVARLGYMAPPGLLHMYLDNYWKMLGEATALHYLGDVVFEHLHPLAGKAEWSEQYAEVNGLMEPDRLEFERYCREDWPDALRRIRG